MFPPCLLPHRIAIEVFGAHAELCGNEAKDVQRKWPPLPPEYVPDTERRKAGARRPAGCVPRPAPGYARCRRRTACNGAAGRLRPWAGRTGPRAGARSACLVSACSISPLTVYPSRPHPSRHGAVRKGIVQRTAQSVVPTPAKPELNQSQGEICRHIG